MPISTKDWTAWYNTMPGTTDPKLHVSGVCELPSSSMSASLQFVTDGIVNEPNVVTLRLVVETPEVGDDLMCDFPVSWQDDVRPDVATTVLIQLPEQTPISVKVEEAT